MKKIIFVLFLAFLFAGFFSNSSYADIFKISISLTEGERSKDSWSSETTISMDGSQAAYSKTYNGHMRGHVEDVSMNCNLGWEQFSKIQSLIVEKHLLSSDSLTDESTKYKGFERFMNLSMVIIMAEKYSKINVNGDVSIIGDKPLYLNSYELINLIKEYIEKC